MFKDFHFVGWQECNTQAPSSTNASSFGWQQHQRPPAPTTAASTITTTQEIYDFQHEAQKL
jgi:hypothetical protein